MHGLRVDLRMARLDERAVLPVRATSASAGMDLHALERTEVTRGQATLVRTGLAMALPEGWEAQIRCRSSLGRKGLIMPNGLGTIDADYRGELMVMMTWIGEGRRCSSSIIQRTASRSLATPSAARAVSVRLGASEGCPCARWTCFAST